LGEKFGKGRGHIFSGPGFFLSLPAGQGRFVAAFQTGEGVKYALKMVIMQKKICLFRENLPPLF
jgi:hypothetical protein